MTFITVFIAKALETILTTLRIVLISHHKKVIGAILNLLISAIWIYSTITIVHNLNNEPYKILGFCLGCFIGSYIGSLFEEKIYKHDSSLICITENKELISKLEKNNIIFKNFKSENNYLLFIEVKCNKKNYVSKLIKSFDKNALLLNGSLR